jgi:hypothetical protein
VALYCTKLHQRLLVPPFDGLDAAVRATLGGASHRLDRALAGLNTCFDHLAAVSGLKVAA